MPHNPLQVVLNANDYQVIPDRQGGGAVKDFYQGRDTAFAAHRDRLLADINQIGRRLMRPDRTSPEYVHVVLNEDAWAKTKRPTSKVLPPTHVPIVGGSRLGDMIVEITPENIGKIRDSVSAAETTVVMALDKKTGDLKPKPSKARGEVGAIQALRPHGAADRRNFSAQDAVKWLADPRTGGMYVVETFVDPRAGKWVATKTHRARSIEALNMLKAQLGQLSLPLIIEDTGERWESVRLILVRLDSSDAVVHETLLRFLDEQPIVRCISLPPVLTIEHVATAPTSESIAVVPPPANDANYPVLGIIDTGVAPISMLESWCAGRTDFLAGATQDHSHGTFIAGLTSAAHAFNPHPLFGEVPCKFFDLGLHPTQVDTYEDYYSRGFIDFLEQLDAEIPAAREAGARVFNMSLSVERQISDDGYGDYAALLDEIADRHDVLFVLPSGNLLPAEWRPAWPKPDDVAPMLASYRYAGRDRLFQPAESVRAVSVGALDPPGVTTELCPTVYTRRGPSTALGMKPDVAHVGGQGGAAPNLFSINPAGQISSGGGTSYAAPMAAKTLAALDHLIEGAIDRETLIGLLIHHSDVPAQLKHPKVARFAPDFVGHGLPAQALDMLVTGDHGITLAFVGTLQASRQLEFPLTWPASMVSSSGACRGRVRMTVVYRAPTHSQFGAEYVRINLDAHLRQEQIDTTSGEVSWKGQLKAEGKIYERHLIEHGHKWWPIKRYEQVMKQGRGNSSQWRLVVESLCRTDTEFPSEGIPFTVLLTIEDPKSEAPVFDELRQTLRASGAKIADIRTAQRIRPRN
jgi:hypothetical protein